LSCNTFVVIPTPLIEVDVCAQPRRGLPLAVVISSTEHGPAIGPHAERIGVDQQWLTAAAAKTSTGSVYPVVQPAGGWVLGLGAATVRDYRRAGAALIRAANTRVAAEHGNGRPAPRTLQVALPSDVTTEQAGAFVVGAVLGGYGFTMTTTGRPPRIRRLWLIAPGTVRPAVRRAMVLARATALSRDLANMPSNTKDPGWLACTAERLSDSVRGLTVQLRDERWLRGHGFGGVLAVGAGSARPPRLIELRWRPRWVQGPHLVLVGKGVTFDTGGISIKPAEGMHMMRTDMAGGGTVIAAMRAIAQLRVPVPVTGLVPAAENHISGSAYRPGDVIRHVDGRTTEVSNTDAEGRMLLADAIGYAVRALRPDVLVDVATLTGSMRVALGWRTGGFFATDDELAGHLVDCGERVGEPWWRMPLGYDVVELATGFSEDVRSELADVRQVPPGPGAVAAALFLREFTGGRRWVHLDIAGAARSEKSYDDISVGATGFATRTLVELARTLSTLRST
jgi:leucyl aminopeptidase